MLVLTRRITDENDQTRIFVGDDIIVTLLEISRNKVRLGITAPDGVQIVREELLSPAQVAAHEAAARR